MIVRDAAPADFARVLALNEESVRFLSPLSAARLEQLHSQAALHVIAVDAGEVAGFLLAFRERAPYDSMNYQWFDQRHARFLYIDRVVVDQRMQSRGAGASLYRHAFDAAEAAGLPLVACEFDVDPPNPASAAFHAKFGFREAGRQLVAGGTKQVSMQIAMLPRNGERR